MRQDVAGGVKPGSNAVREPDFGCILTQIEHVLHVVKTRLAPIQPQGGTYRALGEGHATGRLVGDLDTLAVGGEQHGVITDDVTCAHRGEPMVSRSRAPVCPSRP